MAVTGTHRGERVLVTGGTGFIASHVIRELFKRGYPVRTTVRGSPDDEDKTAPLHAIRSNAKVEESALEIVHGDLLDETSWPDAVKGCSFVIHVASPFPEEEPKHEDDVIKPARDGALNVLKACTPDGSIKRVVLTSSAAAIYSGHGNCPSGSSRDYFDETDWSKLDGKGLGAYEKSKTLAERAAWDYVNGLDEHEKVEMVALLPSFTFGPLIHGKSCTSAMVVRKLLMREAPALPDLSWNCVHVSDIAIAHVNALEAPSSSVNGERFILSSSPMSMKDMSTALAAEFHDQGYRVPTTSAPYWLLWLVSFLDKNLAMALPMIGLNQRVLNDKACRILGLEFRPPEKAVIDTAYSAIELGIVKKTKEYKGATSEDVSS